MNVKPLLFLGLMPLYSIASGIQYVKYHKNTIPNIVTAAGIATEIVFEEDETIKYKTFGFEKAWNSQVVDNHLIFVPQDSEPQTNLIVHTNKRDYIFTITVGNNDWKKHPNNSGAVYAVRMIYNDRKSMKNLAIKAKKEQQAKMRKAMQEKRRKGILRNVDISSLTSVVYANYDYRATQNATNIIPTRVWDNGKITFMSFPNGMKRGVIYELLPNNKVSLVNQHTEKNGLVIVHGVYKKLMIRLGDEAVELRRNELFGKTENYKKTNVIDAQRVVEKNAPIQFSEVFSGGKGLDNEPEIENVTSLPK